MGVCEGRPGVEATRRRRDLEPYALLVLGRTEAPPGFRTWWDSYCRQADAPVADPDLLLDTTIAMAAYAAVATRRATSDELRATQRADRQRVIDRIVAAAQRLDGWDVPGPEGVDIPLVLVRRERYCKLTAAAAELIEKHG